MPVAINQFPSSEVGKGPADAIAKALAIVGSVYGIRADSAKLDAYKAELEKSNLANKKTQIQSDQDQANIKALQTPGSPEGEAEKRGLLGAIALGRQAFPVKDPIAQSALNDTISKLQDPNTTGWQARQMKDSSPLIASLKDFGDKKLTADAMAASAKVKAGPQYERLEETKNQNSIDAGKAFEGDPIIKLSKTSLNSITKSQSILDNPKKPVTTRDLNLAYTDYINSVAAGGAATEGKINRELPETWATDFNTLKAKAGQFDDLRNNPTGLALINQLRENISTVRHDMKQAISDQAYDVFNNYRNSTNPKVKQTAKEKLKAYSPEKYAQEFGGPVPEQSYTSSSGESSGKTDNSHPQDSQAVQWAKSNPGNPKADLILKANGL